jgi:hypothetical protein
MHTWTPPKHGKIVFEVDLQSDRVVPREVARRGQYLKWQRDRRRPFYKKFDLPFDNYGFTTLRLDDTRWPEMLDEIARLTKRGAVGIRGHGIWWLEEPAPRPSNKSAWFEFCAGRREIKGPHRPPGGRHFVSRHYNKLYTSLQLVSERFREVIQQSDLTGLDFLPLEDWDGWYQVWATAPLGRGLDHPLVDPAKLKAKADPDRPIIKPRRRGEPWAWVKYLWDEYEINHPYLARFIELGDDRAARIVGPRRYVEEHLPETDFAYTQWDWQPDRELPWHGRAFRNICCNQRARRFLIDAGLMKPSHFRDPIATIPAAKADSEILDRTINHPIPLPTFTPDEAAEELKRRQAAKRAGPKRATPRPSTTKEVVDLLTKRLANGADPWEPLREDPKLLKRIQASKLYKQLPDSWKQVLPLLPIAIESEEDGDELFEFEPVPPESPSWLEDVSKLASDPDAAPRKDDIQIATTGYGDWYAIRSDDPKLPADARITWWDHETLAPSDEWPTVASLVSHLIEVCDRA